MTLGGSPHDPGGTRLEGVFTTVGCDRGRPILWREHRARLAASMRALAPAAGIRPPDAEELASLLHGLGLHGPAKVRVTALYGGGEEAWRVATDARALAECGPGLAPLRLAVVVLEEPWPAPGHKVLERGPLERARRRAQERGADDALLVDRSGEVLETTVANIFVVRGGRAITPRSPESCLPGIVRGWLLASARVLDVAPVEARVSLAEALAADELWVTNSLVGVRRVAAVDDRVWSSWPVWERLAEVGIPAPGWPGVTAP